MLVALWAQDADGLIGNQGTLPWHLPNDLKFFKEQTMNNTIVMGRKTFEGMDGKVLPKRTSIVLTSDKAYQAPDGVIVMHTRQEVLDYVAKTNEPVFLIGGSGVFESLLSECTDLYRTWIDHRFSGDVYFPEHAIDWNDWTRTKVIEGKVDEANPYPHRFEFYQRTK